VSEYVNLYTAHYKQKVASAPQSRQTEMPLKVLKFQCIHPAEHYGYAQKL